MKVLKKKRLSYSKINKRHKETEEFNETEIQDVDKKCDMKQIYSILEIYSRESTDSVLILNLIQSSCLHFQNLFHLHN